MQTRNGLAERGNDGTGILMGFLLVAMVMLFGFLDLLWPATRPMPAKELAAALAHLDPELRRETVMILATPPANGSLHRRAGDPITPSDLRSAETYAQDVIQDRHDAERGHRELIELRGAVTDGPLNRPAAPPTALTTTNTESPKP